MKFLYYLIVYPISKLSLSFLYVLDSLLYFVVYRLIGYRRKVVSSNLKNSFPLKSENELREIEKGYYHYLSKLFIESIKNISISKEELMPRMVVRNPEIINHFYDQGRSVLLVGSHSYNWEYLITAQNMLFKHQAVGIGKPLSNSFWDRMLTKKRERFGMRVIHAGNVKEKLQEWNKELLAILVLFDQSPRNSKSSYWTNFLNQQTAFLFGTEKMAVSYDFPVIQLQMEETSKGYYQISLDLISENPRSEEYGVIMDKLISNLEKQIITTPNNWLWSHKRWKREVPTEIDILKKEQKQKYLSWKSKL